MDISNNKKLPVIEIFLEAFQLPIKHISSLLRFGAPFIIFGILMIVGSDIYEHQEDDPTTLEYSIGCFMVFMYLATIVMAIIGCHRTFLLPEKRVTDTKAFRWSGREMRYTLWWLGIGIVATMIFLPVIFIITPNFIDEANDDNYLLLSIISIPLYYIISRWSLILPATAIDERNKSLSWSWGLSYGNGWRLTLLIGFLPFITDSLFELLPEIDSVLYSLMVGAIWIVVCVIEIGLLSLSYSFLSKSNTVTDNV